MSLKGENISDNQRLYYFLSSLNLSEDELKRNLDINGDGRVVKSEFSYFAQNNSNIDWSNFGIDENNTAQKKSIINKLWDTLDINNSVTHICNSNMYNQNCLDSTEENKLFNEIERYRVIDEVINECNIKCPVFIYNHKEFMKSVKDSLIYHMDKYKKDASSEEIKEYLKSIVNTSVNKTTANVYAKEYMEEMLKGKIDFYDYTKDSTLTERLLDNLVSVVAQNPNIAESEIKSMAEEMIDAYRASAGLCEMENYNDVLKVYGFAPNSLSGLTSLQQQMRDNKLNALKEEKMAELLNDMNTKIYEVAASYGLLKFNDNVYSQIKSNLIKKINDSLDDFVNKIKNLPFQVKNNEIVFNIENNKEILQFNYGGFINAYNALNTNLFNNCLKELNIENIINEAFIEAIRENNCSFDKEDEKEKFLYELELAYEGEIDVSAPTHIINKDGSITFVHFDAVNGPFDDRINRSAQIDYYEFPQELLNNRYGYILDMLGISEQTRKNMYNAAMFKVLSSIENPYTCKVAGLGLVDSVVEVYIDILDNFIKGDEETKTYIENYHNNSLLGGKTTEGGNAHDHVTGENLGRYFTSNSTAGNDNFIRIDLGENELNVILPNNSSYNIIGIYNASEPEADYNTLNNAMKLLVKDYVENYGSMLSVENIVNLYKTAQRNAFDKLKLLLHNTNVNGNLDDTDDRTPVTNIYGYSNTYSYGGSLESYDTIKDYCFNVGSVLIQIMYEMESLIANTMLSVGDVQNPAILEPVNTVNEGNDENNVKTAASLMSENDVIMNGKTIAQMLQNTNGVANDVNAIQLGGFEENTDFFILQSRAQIQLKNILNDLQTKLINAGYNANSVNTAINRTMLYYNSAIYAINERYCDRNDWVNFIFSDNNSITYNKYYAYVQETGFSEPDPFLFEATCLRTVMDNVSDIDSTGLSVVGLGHKYNYWDTLTFGDNSYYYGIFISLNSVVKKVYDFMNLN